MIPPRFTAEDLDRASEEWGCNCGPGALAAVTGMTLDKVRPLIPQFEQRHYTNFPMMCAALRASGKQWRKYSKQWPPYGLARIQWEGPWIGPGVPVAARYRYTHWVGVKQGAHSLGIFDINAIENGTGWCSLKDWEEILVPAIIEQYKRATGKWHVTHGIHVEEPQ